MGKTKKRDPWHIPLGERKGIVEDAEAIWTAYDTAAERDLPGQPCKSLNFMHEALFDLTGPFEAGYEPDMGAFALGFAFGYVTGQMYDFPDSEIQKKLEEVKAWLLKHRAFPLLPRKAA